MRDFKATSDLVSACWYESNTRADEAYKTATDLERTEDGMHWWSPAVEAARKAWFDEERVKIILASGFTVEEFEALEEQEREDYYRELAARCQAPVPVLPDQFIHMDDDTEPDDVE